MRAVAAKQPDVPQLRRHVGWHAVLRISLAFGRVPQTMRHEFNRDSFRAGHGNAAPIAIRAQASR